MKQRITVEQLKELTPEQQGRLREWWKPQQGDSFTDSDMERTWFADYFDDNHIQIMNLDFCAPKEGCFPLLTIGQMIELLGDKIKDEDNCRPMIWQYPVGKWNLETIDREDQSWGDNHIWIRHKDELADALWKAVKEVL